MDTEMPVLESVQDLNSTLHTQKINLKKGGTVFSIVQVKKPENKKHFSKRIKCVARF